MYRAQPAQVSSPINLLLDACFGSTDTSKEPVYISSAASSPVLSSTSSPLLLPKTRASSIISEFDIDDSVRDFFTVFADNDDALNNSPTKPFIHETIKVPQVSDPQPLSHAKRKRPDEDTDDDEYEQDHRTKKQDLQYDTDDDDSFQIRLEPPPECEYESFEIAEKAIHDWCKPLGYDMVKGKATYNKIKGTNTTQRHKYYYDCGKSGEPENRWKVTDETRQRNRGTRKQNCEASIVVLASNAQDIKGKWKVKHRPGGERSILHNHRAVYAGAIANHRGRERTRKVQKITKHMRDARAAADETLAMLQGVDPETLITRKDINNSRQQTRLKELASHTKWEALEKKMKDRKYWYASDIDDTTDRLTKLLFVNSDCLEIFKANFDTIILDNTYKLNEYNIPVCNVIGSTGMNTTIQLGLAFMTHQDEPAFTWIFNQFRRLFDEKNIPYPRIIVTDRDSACMNALDVVFPDTPALICRWHINNNVKAYCRRTYRMMRNPHHNSRHADGPSNPQWIDRPQTIEAEALYYQALYSTNEASFDDACALMWQKHPIIARYMQDNWWKYKERCVNAWTDKYRHFGQLSTSRVEGWHAKLKKWLKMARSDMITFFDTVDPWMKINNWQYHTRKGYEEATVPQAYRTKDMYTRVRQKIHVDALNKADEQFKLAVQELKKENGGSFSRSSCTNVFTNTLGIPCKHYFMELLDNKPAPGSLKKYDFDPHYFIIRKPGALPKDEPRRVREFETYRRNKQSNATRRRRGGGTTGTAREPILVERTDENHRATPPPLVSTAPVREEQGIGLYHIVAPPHQHSLEPIQTSSSQVASRPQLSSTTTVSKQLFVLIL